MNSIYIDKHLQRLDSRLYDKTRYIHNGQGSTEFLWVIPDVMDFCIDAFEVWTPEP